MTVHTSGTTVSKSEEHWATVTGSALLLMAIAGGFAYGYAHPILHIPNDMKATSLALEANPILLHLSVAAWSLVTVLDLLVTASIYGLYRQRAPKTSLFVASLRLAYSVILAIAVVQLIPLAFEDDVENALFRFDAFERVWTDGLMVFGLHLLGLSYLITITRCPAKFVGILLGLGGVGYIILNGVKSLDLIAIAIPHILELTFNIPMALGELLFAFCLLRVGLAAVFRRLPSSRRCSGVTDTKQMYFK
ncbi:MAG: DUF4386 domain-containing protein [Pseudomonadota bacterium]